MMARRSTFHADLKRFAKKSNMTLDEAHRGIATELFSSTILDTPADEGTLRANWNVSTGSPDRSTNPYAKDPTGALAIASVQTHSMKAGDVTYLTNAMPYAEVAEYGLWSTGSAGQEGSKVTPQGFSKKAPAGMMRKNIARVEAIVRGNVSKAKRKAR